MHANPATKQSWGHYNTITVACGCCQSYCSGQLLKHRGGAGPAGAVWPAWRLRGVLQLQ